MGATRKQKRKQKTDTYIAQIQNVRKENEYVQSTPIRSEGRLRALAQQIIQGAGKQNVYSSFAVVRDQACANCELALLCTIRYLVTINGEDFVILIGHYIYSYLSALRVFQLFRRHSPPKHISQASATLSINNLE